MKIKLSEIKTKSPRVRQSQDPEKLDELAASITAFGQAIIPVGVRKNGQGYDLVYGHRRVAAAKQAGLKEIEAIEVEAGDDMLKVFGLTENVVREDMSAMDVARALQQIKDESGWTNEKIAAFFGRVKGWTTDHLGMLDAEVQEGAKGHTRDLLVAHVREVKAGLGADRTQLPAVIKKVVAEGLSTRQARHVAEEVKNADGKKAIARILREPYERISEATAPLPPSEVIASQWHKPKTANWNVMMNNVEVALRTLDHLIGRLATSKEGKAVIRKFVPKWIKALKALLSTLEAVK
jgi:ParB family chromosome partitioning protein